MYTGVNSTKNMPILFLHVSGYRTIIGEFMFIEFFICLREANRLPLDGFSWNIVFKYFLKICRVHLSFIKISQD
jgi:hypothetical protein